MMTVWHISPDYIANNWSDELLALMLEKLSERNAPKGNKPPEANISDTALIAKASNLVSYKTVKQENNGNKLRGRTS